MAAPADVEAPDSRPRALFVAFNLTWIAYATYYVGRKGFSVAKARIQARIRRLSLGNPGDVKPVGEGVSEMRIDYGPGYRVYFVQRGELLIVLLAGGDKSTQDRDISTALELSMLLTLSRLEDEYTMMRVPFSRSLDELEAILMSLES